MKTGKEGGGVTNVEEEGTEEKRRQSKDRKMNREGRILVDFMEKLVRRLEVEVRVEEVRKVEAEKVDKGSILIVTFI